MLRTLWKRFAKGNKRMLFLWRAARVRIENRILKTYGIDIEKARRR